MNTKLLALISRCCPFCILKRRLPNSRFAKFMEQAEKNCPCCRAYAEVYGKDAPASSAGENPR